MGTESSEKAFLKQKIEIEKKNIENAKLQMAQIRAHKASCLRNNTNFNRAAHHSSIETLKRDIENARFRLAQLREQLKSAK